MEKTYVHCFRCIFCYSTHKEVIFLIKNNFLLFLKNLKTQKTTSLWVGTTKNTPKAMQISFVLLLLGFL
jgi:hypothetical protein